ncbi:hypothetical protein Pan189_00440 [Stratiformator vulcanicus]|uniref:Uncharacterized protein n=1 Tax=Stratiformator vulcanicus TaxID=2527980 RepID=A0A517QVP3_9PLAN|nr:hypothetical protein Pan189_00440 [Stratiformator vulcanicus]
MLFAVLHRGVSRNARLGRRLSRVGGGDSTPPPALRHCQKRKRKLISEILKAQKENEPVGCGVQPAHLGEN